MNERAELVFTFTDMFNDFALQYDLAGNGFTALYQNFLETQVATLALRFRHCGVSASRSSSHLDDGAAQAKFAASFTSPAPRYCATCG